MIRLLDTDDAAQLLGLTPRRLNRLVREREIPFVELPGGEVRFESAVLADFIEEHRVEPAGDVPTVLSIES